MKLSDANDAEGDARSGSRSSPRSGSCSRSDPRSRPLAVALRGAGALTLSSTLMAFLALAGVLMSFPAIAGSEPPSIAAYNEPGGYYHYWMPATATVGVGGGVKFTNPYAETRHGLRFTSGPAGTPSVPSICKGVPEAATTETGATEWSGECTFSTPGTYTFVCTVHPEMTGTITVTAAGTPGPGPTPTPTPAPQPGPGGGQAPAGAPGSLFLGGSKALALRAAQHGPAVRGSIDIAPAGAGGRLEVALFAAGASLARAHSGARARSARVRIGRIVRSSVKAGVVSFVAPLGTRGRSALRRHRRLAVTVRIVLTPVAGAAAVMTRSVELRG